jgi:transposase
MNTTYSPVFRARMVKRLLRPSGPTPYQLSKEVEVPYQTLSRWLKAARLDAMTAHDDTPKPASSLTAAEKLALVHEAEGLGDAELGTFLRKRGIRTAELEQWREVALAALDTRRGGGQTREARRIRELERDLRRKEKALAEHATLLALKKRPEFAILWGDEDTDTPKGNGER